MAGDQVESAHAIVQISRRPADIGSAPVMSTTIAA
jgi:hypothetical protein